MPDPELVTPGTCLPGQASVTEHGMLPNGYQSKQCQQALTVLALS